MKHNSDHDNHNEEDDGIDISNMTADEYKEHMRRIEQLTSCPCTNCTDRCWDTGMITECKPYRRWWRQNNGVRYDR